jgi:hypothetical protein
MGSLLVRQPASGRVRPFEQVALLTATMNAWLGGDESIVWPGLAVSAGGLALNAGLFGYLRRLERTRGGG